METSSSRVAGEGRLVSLDGLRGLAALTVLLFHVCLSFAWLSGDRYTGSITDLLSFTPLHVIFQGREAVHLFFVLSGYTLPALLHRIKPLSWQYLISRSVRLYVPAWLALGFYMLITSLMSKLLQVEASFGPPEKILRDFVLVLGPEPGTQVMVAALWSLAFEILFSWSIVLWLPLTSWRFPLALLSIFVVIITLGDALKSGLIQYMPMFLMGMTLFHNKKEFETATKKFLEKISGGKLMLIAVTLLALPYVVKPLLPLLVGHSEPNSDLINIYFYGPEFLGIVMVLGLALWDSRSRNTLSSAAFQWLGKVSFSLYLTHQIVLGAVDALPLPEALSVIMKIVLALGVAHGFYFLFERPVHLMARRISTHP